MSTRGTTKTSRAVHMVGIGGAGMSALARLYLQQGLTVRGTDEAESGTVSDLRALGAAIQRGHAAVHLDHPDFLVYSSAVPESNPELVEARRRGLPCLKHADALAELVNARRGIAVAGTHGKTTTSSMIAFILERCGLQPSFQIGGELVDLGTSARLGSGDWMVVEADEFDRRFLAYTPEIAVITNVEPDHFEYYTSVDEMEGAFAAFVQRVQPAGIIVACGAEARLEAILASHAGQRQIVRYGVPEGDTVPESWACWATDVLQPPGGSTFMVHLRDDSGAMATCSGQLIIPGRHHVLNALAAVAVCARLGVAPAAALAQLAGFHGARRRFQTAGEGNGVRVYVDYAHHPTEVRVNLEAGQNMSGIGRLWAVFQPHLLTRTEMLFDQFVGAFGAADQVLITDVYSPRGREPEGTYRGAAELVAAMNHPHARHVRDAEAARAVLRDELRPGDLVLVMGAGPIDEIAPKIAQDLASRPAQRAAGG